MAMMAMTTNSSISVKPRRVRMRSPLSGPYDLNRTTGLAIEVFDRFDPANSHSGSAQEGRSRDQTEVSSFRLTSTRTKEKRGVKFALDPYPIASALIRKEVPDISRRDHLASNTHMRAARWSWVERTAKGPDLDSTSKRAKRPIVGWRLGSFSVRWLAHGCRFGQNESTMPILTISCSCARGCHRFFW
jgi:hypothetical protein